MKSPHIKACQCEACVKNKVAAFLDRIKDTSRLVPESLAQTVPVRAHWRRHPGHLKKQPIVLKALKQELRLLSENV